MIRQRLLGLGAAALLLGLLVGLPVTLLAVGANPIPSSVPTLDELRVALSSPDDGTLVLQAVTVIAWVAWVALAASILLEIAAAIRGVRSPHLPGLAIPQGAARHLVAAAALLFVVSSTNLATASSSRAEAPSQPTVVSAMTMTSQHTKTPTASEPSPTRSYTVREGDSLSGIAQRELGDLERWPEILELSRHTLQPGGVRLSDPDQIDVGWTLSLPVKSERGATPVRSYTVREGDSLSGIAQRELGDLERWPEILELSKHTLQPGGVRLSDPDQIDVGWTLSLPAAGTSSPAVPNPHRTGWKSGRAP